MKNVVILFLIIFCLGNLSAEIVVKSFRKLESDMTARIDAPMKDQNGDVCAIIKVVTTQTGFIWEPDGLGIISAENKGGEYWIYIPFGAKRLTIKHPQLGVLRDYLYTIPIEKATVYEMILISGRIETKVIEEINSQWLIINPDPAIGNIYIDDVFVKTGIYQAKLKPGTYTYRVEAPLYHTEAGKFEVTDTKKELSVTLKPNFGFISVNTLPENDAQVIIDGKVLSNKTPCKSEALKSGEYTVQVIKEMFQPTAQKVTITDGQTTAINFTLQPNFAELTINVPTEAALYINNELKGKGTWKGRLSAGVYSLEARLNQHKNEKQDIELNTGENRIINLQPQPIYGSLDVVTNPIGATIIIDGKEYGTTPNTINKLLIGDYKVQLIRQGYASVCKTVRITENASVMLNETLSNGREVTINSTPQGANLLIDDSAVGKTPFKGNLSFGNHTLKIESGGKTNEQKVEIKENSTSTFTISIITCGAYVAPNVWKEFMCHNLGANTALNPMTYSEGINGDLYQWGRPTDGHEKRTSSTTTTLATSNNPGHSSFIVTSSSPYDWRSGGGNDTRWTDDTKAVNDPCPTGFKVPSQTQWTGVVANNTKGTWASGYKFGDKLFLPASGIRYYVGGPFYDVGAYGLYWSSTVIGANAYNLYYSNGGVYASNYNGRAGGFSVRCVAE